MSRTARNAGLLVGLLAVFFVLVSYQANRTRTLSTARNAVIGTVSPFQRVAVGTATFFSSIWGSYGALVGAAQENEELRAEVHGLRQEVRSLEEIRRENERLRALLGVGIDPARRGVVASVVGRDIASRFQAVTIGVGSFDGVALDSPVVAPGGAVVGRVTSVAPFTSQVQLLTDPLSGIGARLATSRATGLVSGTDGKELQLRYVDSLTPVAEGESVITSGDDGIYPPGLLIGHVENFRVGPPVPGTPRVPLSREQSALFLEIVLAPAVDVTRLETVLVLDPDSPVRR